MMLQGIAHTSKFIASGCVDSWTEACLYVASWSWKDTPQTKGVLKRPCLQRQISLFASFCLYSTVIFPNQKLQCSRCSPFNISIPALLSWGSSADPLKMPCLTVLRRSEKGQGAVEWYPGRDHVYPITSHFSGRYAHYAPIFRHFSGEKDGFTKDLP